MNDKRMMDEVGNIAASWHQVLDSEQIMLLRGQLLGLVKLHEAALAAQAERIRHLISELEAWELAMKENVLAQEIERLQKVVLDKQASLRLVHKAHTDELAAQAAEHAAALARIESLESTIKKDWQAFEKFDERIQELEAKLVERGEFEPVDYVINDSLIELEADEFAITIGMDDTALATFRWPESGAYAIVRRVPTERTPQGQQGEQLAEAIATLKLVYRKHHLGDDRIGWDELSEKVLDTLSNLMGVDKLVEWQEGDDVD